MNLSNLSNFIKTQRELRKTTQNELAANICSVREITRIEKGESYPSFYTLERILGKLGYDLTQYFQFFLSKEDIQLYNEALEIWYLVNQCNYKVIENRLSLLKQKKYNPWQDKFFCQFSLIIDSILYHKLYHNTTEALDLAYRSLAVSLPKFKKISLVKCPLVLSEYRILNYIAEYHIKLQTIEIAIEILKNIKYSLADNTFLIRTKYIILPDICLNLSKCYIANQLFYETIPICEEGIQICIKTNTFNCLSELYFSKAHALYHLHHIEKAKEYFHRSYTLLNSLMKFKEAEKILKKINENFKLKFA